MSNNKKNKKNNKRMNPETKAKIFQGIKTIISNNACRDAAREWKGGLQAIPVVLAVVATILAVVPTLTSQLNVQGSSAVYGSPTAEFDIGLCAFTHDLTHDKNGTRRADADIVHVSWDDKGNMTTKNLDKIYTRDANDAITHKWYTLKDNLHNVTIFEVFFSESFKDEQGNYKYTDDAFFKMLARNEDPETGNTRTESSTVSASYIAFGQNAISFRKYTSAIGTLEGRYDRLNGIDLANLGPAETVGYLTKDYKTTVAKNWVNFINLTYETTKVRSAWTFTGIMAGVDFGIILLFGLLLFVMTRGKNNPYRVVNIWETMKMAGWASFTPALLTLIFGFWLVQYAYLIFMFTYGLRMMWLSMKSLRPMAQ